MTWQDVLSYAVDPGQDLKKRILAQRRAQAKQGLSTHYVPSMADQFADLVGQGYGGLHHLFGASEREAAQRGGRLSESLSTLSNVLPFGSAVERSGRQVARGTGTGWDALNVGAAALSVPGVAPAVAGGARMAVPYVKALTPAPVRRAVGAVADYLGHAPEVVPAEYAHMGGHEVSLPGMEGPTSLRVTGAPSRSLAVPGAPRITSRRPPAPLALTGRAAKPLVDGPPKPAALLDEDVQTPLDPNAVKARGGPWWPDISVKRGLSADEAGYSVRDRGEHAHPLSRYQVVYPSGEGGPSFHAEDLAQYHADKRASEAGSNLSPEYVGDLLGFEAPIGTPDAVQDRIRTWLKQYLANDFGTTHDPVPKLIREGNFWNPRMTEKGWNDIVNQSLEVQPLGNLTLPTHGLPAGDIGYDLHYSPDLLREAPWLREKNPTKPVYGIKKAPPLKPFVDTITDVLNPASDIPAHLKIDPDTVGKLNFPAALGRVGDVFAHRRKEAEEASLAAFDHPAVEMFKRYPELPGPMIPGTEPPLDAAWVELRPPKPSMDILPDIDKRLIQHGEETGSPLSPESIHQAQMDASEAKLRQVLGYESQGMSHCVGKNEHGYCETVMDGRGRIFSLRDKEGNPRVTIETARGASPWEEHGPIVIPRNETYLHELWNDYRGATDGGREGFPDWLAKEHPTERRIYKDYFDQPPDSIPQIMGYSNRKPDQDWEHRPEGSRDTLPPLDVQSYISDFVKGGKWTNVDTPHTNLIQVPNPGEFHRRYMDEADFYKVINEKNLDFRYPRYDPDASRFPRNPMSMRLKDWNEFGPDFEGYAKGGAVRSPRRQFEVDPGLIERAVMDAASAEYPFIRGHDPVLTEGSGEGGAETWLIGDEGGRHPRPLSVPMGKLGIEAYQRMGLGDVAGEVLHGDDRANAVRRDLSLSLTPEQWARLKHGSLDYGDDASPESEERRRNNAVDGLIRGYTVGQWPGVADEIGLTENQRGPLDNLGVYMKRGY